MADEEKTEPGEEPVAEGAEPEASAEAPEPEAAETPAEEPAAGEPEPAPAPARKAAKPKAERKATPKKPSGRAGQPAAERGPIVRGTRPDRPRGKQKERRGVVVSSAMDKTIVVRVDTIRPHPAYKKVVRRSKKFHAHDEQNAAGVGDVVRIMESRPVSKTKVWRLAEILEVAK